MLRLVRLGRTRNAYAPELIELFLVAAVASVLAIRAFLALTGWPQIGGAGLHIAHMLWGGLFMLLAMLLLFTMLGRAAQRFAAILGGVGFGTFIDELGKFITSDNDYHYQPTIGLIYIVFIAIFLALRAVRSRADLDPDTALANSLTLLGPVSGNQLDAGTKQETLQLLAKADAANPLVPALTAYVAGVETGEALNPGFYFRIRDRLSREYSQVVLHRRFQPALLAVFTIFALAQIAIVVLTIAVGIISGANELRLSFTATAQLASSLVAAAIIVWGIWRLRRSRLVAYRWFTRAILVSIFVTQVFAFLESEFATLGGLAISILIYTALRYMIERELNTATESS